MIFVAEYSSMTQITHPWDQTDARLSDGTYNDVLIPVATCSRAKVCGCSPAEIVGSNPAGGHGWMSVVSVVCCQIEASVTS